MTGTRVNPERQSFTVLLANQQRNRGNQGLGSGTPPPPQGWGSGGFLPCCRLSHPVNSQTAGGAI